MLPTGTVTFLFTDIEGSTRLWEQHPREMQTALSRHDQILEASINTNNGQVVKKRGDGYHAVFNTPQGAVAASLEIQHNLANEEWDKALGGIRVRMSLHTASTKQREGDYYGSQVNRAARLEAAAHGGQILLSLATHELVQDDLPEGAYLIDLGEHRLKDLTRPEHIYQLCAPGLAARFPPIRSLDPNRTNLPIIPTSFVGRETELQEVCKLIGDEACHLLTLVGPGGIGKTRLAIQIAAELVDHYPNGAYLVTLTPVPRPEYIVPTIVDAFGFGIDTHSSNLDPKSQLLDYLKSRSLLLVLDNFEHLIEGAGLLPEIITSAPQIKIIVTSRERLNLQDEWTYDVSGLSYPTNGKVEGIETYSAVQLFLERARQVNTRFILGPEERLAVKRICQLVEGMPLGIELAAAWMSILSPGEILSEIEKNLDILASRRRDIEEKHRSIRAVFDYSWRRLSEQQQRGFGKLSVFRGGFTRDAAREVAGVDFLQLSDFLDRSLLRRSIRGRYNMHELLRSYAAELLSTRPLDYESVNHKHSRYYLSFLEERLPELPGERMRELREEIRQEIENLRAAIFWIVANWETDQAREALFDYEQFYEVQGWHEGKQVFHQISLDIETKNRDKGLESLGQDPIYLCARTIEACFLSFLTQIRESEEIIRSCMEGLSSQGMQFELGISYISMGVNSTYLGKHEQGIQQLKQGIEIFEAIQSYWLGVAFLFLGYIYYELGDTTLALDFLEQSLEFAISQNNIRLSAFALSKLGLVHDELKEHTKAWQYHIKGRDIFIKFGDKAGEGYTNSRLCTTAFFMGNHEEAIHYGEIGLERFYDLGHRWGIDVSMCRLGFPQLAIGNDDIADTYFSTALERALQNQMMLLVNYALIGKACILIERGMLDRAAEIYAFVKNHPQTPPFYYMQAESWFDELEAKVSAEKLAEIEASLKGIELETFVHSVLGEGV